MEGNRAKIPAIGLGTWELRGYALAVTSALSLAALVALFALKAAKASSR